MDEVSGDPQHDRESHWTPPGAPPPHAGRRHTALIAVMVLTLVAVSIVVVAVLATLGGNTTRHPPESVGAEVVVATGRNGSVSWTVKALGPVEAGSPYLTLVLECEGTINSGFVVRPRPVIATPKEPALAANWDLLYAVAVLPSITRVEVDGESIPGHEAPDWFGARVFVFVMPDETAVLVGYDGAGDLVLEQRLEVGTANGETRVVAETLVP